MKSKIFLIALTMIVVSADAANSWPTSMQKYPSWPTSLNKFPSWPTELTKFPEPVMDSVEGASKIW